MLLLLHERIKGSESVSVSSSVFEYFSFTEEGGAVSISASNSLSVAFEECLFRVCFSEKAGGAIYASSVSTSFTLSKSCFEMCSITVKKNEYFGNAFNVMSSKSGEAQVNQTLFYFCGPKMEISSDTTAYLSRNKAFFSSPNFTECYSYFGSCTVGINLMSAKVLYMQSTGGISLHLSFFMGSEKFEIEKSNMVNWTQYNNNYPDVIFHRDTGKTEFKDCVIFIIKSYTGTGPCAFSNCYGNLNHEEVTSTSFTEFDISEVSYGIYCRGFVNVHEGVYSSKMPWEKTLVLEFCFLLLI